ncbi:MAG: hypothetical protein ACJAU4_000870 [Glaciecola sp.]|jgi:hypothetical protein
MKLNRITTLLMLSSLPLLANSASYTVVELPSTALSLNQFGSSIDETGLVLTTLSNPFNPPIDLSLLDLSLFTLNDPEGAAEGNFEDADYQLIASFIYAQSQNNSLFGQKLSLQLGYKTDGTSAEYISGLDQGSDGTNGFTFAQTTTLGDSTNRTHIVGSMAGSYNQVPYTSTDVDGTELIYTVNEFSKRGFVQVGDNVTELVPEDTTAGGVSSAVAINANLQVAGATGIGASEGLTLAIESCVNEETRGDQPIEACLYTLRLTDQTGSDRFSSSTIQRAAVWQMDANGELLTTTIYGLVFEPDDITTAVLSTSANAINDNGVAVGVSDAPFFERNDDTAVIFENGVTTRIIEDESLMPNAATGINNNGIIVGYQTYAVGQSLRTKMFTFDRNTDTLNFPNGFFINSSTIPRAINNNNLVVGDADSEAGEGSRQKNAFLYNIDTDAFINLNSLVACDANVNIITADDINDSDEIVASALVKRPARNIQGEVISSEDGGGLVDTMIAIKLIPTGNAPSDCSLTEEEVFASERQGAGVGFMTIIGLFIISVFRRRIKKT